MSEITDDKEGKYCQVCGGVVPEGIHIRRILVDGKDVGLDQLDFIIDDVLRLELTDDTEIAGELLKRVKVFNYVPTKKNDAYSDALLREYKKRKSARPHDP